MPEGGFTPDDLGLLSVDMGDLIFLFFLHLRKAKRQEVLREGRVILSFSRIF